MVENKMTATPKFPLGTYVFNPSETDPAAEAWFQNQFNTFTQFMGAKPLYSDAFVNYYADWSQWVPTMDGTARSWAASPVLRGVTPVTNMPMATTSDWNNQDQVFKDIIAGKHDDVFVGLVNSWKKVGYAAIDIRIGPEMNGTFEPWYMGNDPATVADWKEAFRHIATLVRSVPGIAVRTVWNPANLNWTGQPTSSSYPGDKYVDVIGVDTYSTVYPPTLYDWHKNDGSYAANIQEWFADPVNREHYWANPNATEWNPNGHDPSQWGMKQALAFAANHKKPIGIAEAGAGGDGTRTGPVDDPDFPRWLYNVLSLPGAPKVDYVNIWNINPGDGDWEFTNGKKPLEAAAWKQYFGVPAPSAGESPAAATSISLSDNAGTRFLTALKPGATADFSIGSTGLKAHIGQWSVGGTVTGIGADSFDAVQAATLTDGTGGSFALNNFNEANVSLSGASTAAGAASTLGISNAARGSLSFGSGNYNAAINVRSDSADAQSNIFRVNMGTGTDILALEGDPGRTAAVINAGSGTTAMSFVNVLNATVTGGSGAASVLFGTGTGTVTAGSGIMDVTGGAGADTYVVHAGIGLMIVENFSPAQGDTLQIDKALQASLQEQQQASGVMLSFGDPAHGVLLKGLTTPAPTSIAWV